MTISGIVNGDVFAGAGSLFIDGQINGDLIAGAGTITLVGDIIDSRKKIRRLIYIFHSFRDKYGFNWSNYSSL